MATTSQSSSLFPKETRTAFQQYLNDHPNKRRVSRNQRLELVGIVTNPEIRPSSQQEFSRRHYVKKTFMWDAKSQTLFTTASGTKPSREVVAEDEIVDVVETVHLSTGHAGWDATWKGVSSSYYGILRADVIFLIKQCPICVQDPRKRPKGGAKSDSVDTRSLPFEEFLHFTTDGAQSDALDEGF